MDHGRTGSSSYLWEKLSHVGAIFSALVALAALAASTYQFRESVRLQERAINLQAVTLQVGKSGKAAEIFERYIEVRSTSPGANLSREEKSLFYIERNNRALRILNALYSTTKGDDQWEDVVFSSLQRFTHVAQDRNVRCEPLTEDFRRFIKLAIPETTDKSMCSDYIDSE